MEECFTELCERFLKLGRRLVVAGGRLSVLKRALSSSHTSHTHQVRVVCGSINLVTVKVVTDQVLLICARNSSLEGATKLKFGSKFAPFCSS